MKKLLLGLGTLSLAILPVAAMVSCSAEEPIIENKATVKTEAKKLNIEVASKIKDVTTTDVTTAINDAKTPAEKILAIKKYATLPTIATGFTLEVKSATTVDVELSTVVEIMIVVSETATPEKTANATFSITELKVDQTIPTLASEVDKFKTAVSTSITDTALIAEEEFTNATTPAGKLEALNIYYLIPKLAEGFTLEVKSGKVNPTTNTTLDVFFRITNSKSKSLDGVLHITSFVKPSV
jgi:hypothetical protein